jgi:repressor LexA
VKLTKKQQAIYDSIVQYREKNGYSPSQNEIAEMQGIARGTVRGHLKVLKAKGYIAYARHTARSIAIIPP